MNTASILTDFETCPRKGYYSRSWSSQRLKSSQMTLESIRTGLLAQNGVWGELAGASMLQLAEDRGLDTESCRIYQSVIHHSCIADLVVTAVRKSSDPAWLVPEPVQNWTSGCFLSPDGNSLRRVVLVSHWTDERHYSECRSWYSLGEQAFYNLPMSLIVAVIGQQRDGLRSGPWSTGFLHPSNHQLRFRKKFRSVQEAFNDRWERIHREDHAEITREKWLESMLKDDVLREVLFRVDIPVPPRPHLVRIRQMAERKLQRLYDLKKVPDGNLSTCDFPIPCQFRKLCHVLPEKEPSEDSGFIQVNSASYPGPQG